MFGLLTAFKPHPSLFQSHPTCENKAHAFLPLAPAGTSKQVSPSQEVGTLIPCPLTNHGNPPSHQLLPVFQTILKPAWEPALLSSESFILVVINHFMPSLCLCSFITNIQTSGALVLPTCRANTVHLPIFMTSPCTQFSTFKYLKSNMENF